MRFIHSWVFGLEVIESLGVRRCIACDCQLTVKQILFDRVDFIESRNRNFNVDTFKELFEKVPPDSIVSYLHGIGLFYRLWNILRI